MKRYVINHITELRNVGGFPVTTSTYDMGERRTEVSHPASGIFYTMKILFILTLCFYINVEAQCKSNKSIYGNAISVLYEKLLKDEVLEKTDTLYLILDEKANLNKEQDKISKNISFKVPFLRLGESSPIYKMNPYLMYKKNRVSK